MHHRPGWRHKAGLPDVMPLFLAADCTMDKLHQFIVRGAATHQPAQIMVPDRKKTSTNLAIGGDPDSAPVATEWLIDRRDDSELWGGRWADTRVRVADGPAVTVG